MNIFLKKRRIVRDFRRRIRGSVMKVQLFDGALRQTKRMLEADYRTAIPQYYNHGIQFLIPVCLQNPDRADLALACVRQRMGANIMGRTCLTIKNGIS